MAWPNPYDWLKNKFGPPPPVSSIPDDPEAYLASLNPYTPPKPPMPAARFDQQTPWEKPPTWTATAGYDWRKPTSPTPSTPEEDAAQRDEAERLARAADMKALDERLRKGSEALSQPTGVSPYENLKAFGERAKVGAQEGFTGAMENLGAGMGAAFTPIGPGAYLLRKWQEATAAEAERPVSEREALERNLLTAKFGVPGSTPEEIQEQARTTQRFGDPVMGIAASMASSPGGIATGLIGGIAGQAGSRALIPGGIASKVVKGAQLVNPLVHGAFAGEGARQIGHAIGDEGLTVPERIGMGLGGAAMALGGFFGGRGPTVNPELVNLAEANKIRTSGLPSSEFPPPPPRPYIPTNVAGESVRTLPLVDPFRRTSPPPPTPPGQLPLTPQPSALEQMLWPEGWEARQAARKTGVPPPPPPPAVPPAAAAPTARVDPFVYETPTAPAPGQVQQPLRPLEDVILPGDPRLTREGVLGDFFRQQFADQEVPAPPTPPEPTRPVPTPVAPPAVTRLSFEGEPEGPQPPRHAPPSLERPPEPPRPPIQPETAVRTITEPIPVPLVEARVPGTKPANIGELLRPPPVTEGVPTNPNYTPLVHQDTGQFSGIVQIKNPFQVQVDPATYQFKEADARGVTGRLAHIQEYSPNAPPLTIHERLDGTLKVADGHQRLARYLELASEGKTMPPLRARVLREAEGFDVATVRRAAAIQNIQEGSAGPIDIAKLLRGGPLEPHEQAVISPDAMTGRTLRKGQGLAKLAEPVWQSVAAGELDPHRAWLIGELFDNPAQQQAVAQMLRRSRFGTGEISEAATERFLRTVKNRGFKTETQQDLLGEMETAQPLIETETDLLGSTRRVIADQRTAFSAAVRNRERLQAAGNMMADAENIRQADLGKKLGFYYDKYVNAAGTHLRSEINAVTPEVAAGRLTPEAATQRLLDALQRDIAGQPLPGGGAAAQPGVGAEGAGVLQPGPRPVVEAPPAGEVQPRGVTPPEPTTKITFEGEEGGPPPATPEEVQRILQTGKATLDKANQPLPETFALDRETLPPPSLKGREQEFGQKNVFEEPPAAVERPKPVNLAETLATEPVAPEKPANLTQVLEGPPKAETWTPHERGGIDIQTAQDRVFVRVNEEWRGKDKTPPVTPELYARGWRLRRAEGTWFKTVTPETRQAAVDEAAELLGAPKSAAAPAAGTPPTSSSTSSDVMPPKTRDEIALDALAAEAAQRPPLSTTRGTAAQAGEQGRVPEPAANARDVQVGKEIAAKAAERPPLESTTGTYREPTPGPPLDPAAQELLTTLKAHFANAPIPDAPLQMQRMFEAERLGAQRLRALEKTAVGRRKPGNIVELLEQPKTPEFSPDELRAAIELHKQADYLNSKLPKGFTDPVTGEQRFPQPETGPVRPSGEEQWRRTQERGSLLEDGSPDALDQYGQSLGRLQDELWARDLRNHPRAGDETKIPSKTQKGEFIGGGLFPGAGEVAKAIELYHSDRPAFWRLMQQAGRLGGTITGAITGYNTRDDAPIFGAIEGAVAGYLLTSPKVYNGELLKSMGRWGKAVIGQAPKQTIDGRPALRWNIDPEDVKDISWFTGNRPGTVQNQMPALYEKLQDIFGEFTNAVRSGELELMSQKQGQAFHKFSVKAAADTAYAMAEEYTTSAQPNKATYARRMGDALLKKPTVGQIAWKAGMKHVGIDVKFDTIERIFGQNVYRMGIGWALDSAAANLTQPVLGLRHFTPADLIYGYRMANTAEGRAATHGLEIKRPVNMEFDIEGEAPVKKTDPGKLMAATDNYNRRVTYLAAQRYATRKLGLDAIRADTWAQRVMTTSQGDFGATGMNPLYRGPVMGTLRPYQKFPALLAENFFDALAQPNKKTTGTFIATVAGLTYLGNKLGIDIGDMLLMGGKVIGVDPRHPIDSIEQVFTGQTTPAGRFIKDVGRHIAGTANHPVLGLGSGTLDELLSSDLAGAVGRYPVATAQRALRFARQGTGTHLARSASGAPVPMTALEDLLNQVGVKSPRQTESQRFLQNVGNTVATTGTTKRADRAEIGRLLGQAVDRGDMKEVSRLLAQLGTVGSAKSAVKRLQQDRFERLYQQASPEVRAGMAKDRAKWETLQPR